MDVYAQETSQDVFNVYMSIEGGISKPIQIEEDVDPPEWAFPNTFIGYATLQAAFPGANIIKVGSPPPPSTKVAQGPSLHELDAATKQYTPVEVGDKTRLGHVLLPVTIPSSATILLTFQSYLNEYHHATRKRKELAKAYCNGMAKAIKMIYPELESELAELAAGTKTEKDLL